MSFGDGHGGHGAGEAVAAARQVVLVRYRRGAAGETARTVHMVPLPTTGPVSAISALCGASLTPGDLEIVTPGEGMPCTGCLINHVTGPAPVEEPPTNDPDSARGAGPTVGGIDYQQWGWPVTLHRDQVRLSLCRDVSALAVPIPLCDEVNQILTAEHCTPVVLAHPYAPQHHIMLTGEKYGVMLPWPDQVHQVTGFLLLPPTMTPRGPVTWIHPPEADSLWLCREIDLFATLRNAVTDRDTPTWDTADASRDRPIPQPPDPNKHDR